MVAGGSLLGYNSRHEHRKCDISIYTVHTRSSSNTSDGKCSLPIHIPQCQRKWLLEEESKPKNERRPLPSQPNADKAIGGGGGKAYDNFNAEAFAAFEKTLTQCPNCQRRFNPKSFHKHQRGCTIARPAKPAGTGLIKYSLTNRLVPGAVAGSMHGKASGYCYFTMTY